MDYYLLSEQDLDELSVDIENFLFDLKEKIETKSVNKDEYENEDEESLYSPPKTEIILSEDF